MKKTKNKKQKNKSLLGSLLICHYLEETIQGGSYENEIYLDRKRHVRQTLLPVVLNGILAKKTIWNGIPSW